MTDQFVAPLPHPNEKSGIRNHYSRMTRDEAQLQKQFQHEPVMKRYANRVIIIVDTLEEVKELQARLPEMFHELEPVFFEDLVLRDERAEPQRLIWITPAYLGTIQGTLKHFFFAPYSIISKNGDGLWTDLRDVTSCRWGRWTETNLDTVRSSQVLNGEVVL